MLTRKSLIFCMTIAIVFFCSISTTMATSLKSSDTATVNLEVGVKETFSNYVHAPEGSKLMWSVQSSIESGQDVKYEVLSIDFRGHPHPLVSPIATGVVKPGEPPAEELKFVTDNELFNNGSLISTGHYFIKLSSDSPHNSSGEATLKVVKEE